MACESHFCASFTNVFLTFVMSHVFKQFTIFQGQSHTGIVLKQLNLSWNNQHCVVAYESATWAIKEPTYFCLSLRKNQRLLISVSTVWFNNERHIWWYEFHPPHLMMLPHCLVKAATPKTHIITNSCFNVIYERVFKVSTTSTHTTSDGRATGQS